MAMPSAFLVLLLLPFFSHPACRAARPHEEEEETAPTSTICSSGWAFHASDPETTETQSEPDVIDKIVGFFTNDDDEAAPKDRSEAMHQGMFHQVRLVYVVKKAAESPDPGPFCDVLACPEPVWEKRLQIYNGDGSPGDVHLRHLPPCDPSRQNLAASQLTPLQGQEVLGRNLSGPDAIAEILHDQLAKEAEKLRDDKPFWAEFADELGVVANDYFGDDFWTPSPDEQTPVMKRLLNTVSLINYDFKPISAKLMMVDMDEKRQNRMKKNAMMFDLASRLSETTDIKTNVLDALLISTTQLRSAIEAAAPALAQCAKQSTSTEVEAWRANLTRLNEMQTDHRSDEQAQMMAIGTGAFQVASGILFVAADAGLPGVGSALNGVQQATRSAADLASRFSASEKIAGFSGKMTGKIFKGFSRVTKDVLLQTKMLEEVDQLLAKATLKVMSSEAAVAAVEGATEAFKEAASGVVEEAAEGVADGKDLTGGSFRAVKKLFKAKMKQAAGVPIKVARGAAKNWKSILKDSMQAAVQEGGWTAASFIPIVGPFAGLARNMADLADAVKEQHMSRSEYFGTKDPILRSMIRMRDCLLESFLRSDVFSLRAHLNPRDDVMALLAAFGFVRAAADINTDLLPRFHKWTHIGQSKDKHEKSIMKRLQGKYEQSAMKRLQGQVVKPDKEQGDSYLSDEISPSAWHAKFGELISSAALDQEKFEAKQFEVDYTGKRGVDI